MNDYGGSGREPMLDMFIFESNQLLESLEEILLHAEKAETLTKENINEIFRIMHTIKGSAGMMMFSPIAALAHSVEDLFFHIRDRSNETFDFRAICDLVLQAADALKAQIQLVEAGEPVTAAEESLLASIRNFLQELQRASGLEPTGAGDRSVKPKQFYISNYEKKNDESLQKYHAHVRFDQGCEMENIRAYSLVFSLQDHCVELFHDPVDLIGDATSGEKIVADGFKLWFSSKKAEEELRGMVNRGLFVSEATLEAVSEFPAEARPEPVRPEPVERLVKRPVIVMPELQGEAETASDTNSRISEAASDGSGPVSGGAEATSASEPGVREAPGASKAGKGNLISVNIQKLDMLMDLVGEIVITESMVTRCPELAGLQLDVFHKSANQLRKLTDELQDIVMSIRMLPISGTFQKMHRIIRDMTRRLDKDAELVLVGEETEVDKNLIDQLADPLMHLVRNAMDHGLETRAERKAAGKPEKGRIVLEARNDGGEIWIEVKDDGKGLNKERILAKAREHGLTSKADNELTEKEIFGFIMLPGFSTKESVSEFSGRGVGMDVVRENITRIGGSIYIDSQWGKGSTITIRIPLTLAIIDGMLISVGDSSYIIPTMAIRESLRAEPSQAIRDAEGHELLMIRGEAFPIIRLHRRFQVEGRAHALDEGIVVVIEHEGTSLCLFADELLGEQHVVVKPLPAYFRQVNGISGCTILGDGSISLILDVGGLDVDRPDAAAREL